MNDIFQDVQRDFARSEDPTAVAFGAALTKKEILCSIGHVSFDSIYDFYDLALYRSKSCGEITAEEFEASESAANEMRTKVKSCDVIQTF